MTTSYQTYTLTQRGGFQTRYNGTSLEEARKAYQRLASQNKPRILNKTEGGVTQHLETWGLY